MLAGRSSQCSLLLDQDSNRRKAAANQRMAGELDQLRGRVKKDGFPPADQEGAPAIGKLLRQLQVRLECLPLSH